MKIPSNYRLSVPSSEGIIRDDSLVVQACVLPLHQSLGLSNAALTPVSSRSATTSRITGIAGKFHLVVKHTAMFTGFSETPCLLNRLQGSATTDNLLFHGSVEVYICFIQHVYQRNATGEGKTNSHLMLKARPSCSPPPSLPSSFPPWQQRGLLSRPRP